METLRSDQKSSRKTAMTLMEFETEWEKLMSWFNIKSMRHEQINRVFERCKFYPVPSLEHSVEQIIEDRRPTAGNFPTINEIINGCWKWLDQHPDIKFERTEFDPIEDLSYPTIKLWDGFNILQARGKESFMFFAEKNRMPKNDIDRVMMKHNCVISGKNPKPEVLKMVKKIGV